MWTAFVGISTLTWLTPSNFPTAPSIACWQCSQEMSGATRVVDSMIYSPLIQVKHLESNLYNSSLQCCSRSELHSEKVKGSIALPSGKMKEISLRISSNRVELDQLLNDFLFTIPFYPLRDTGS